LRIARLVRRLAKNNLPAATEALREFGDRLPAAAETVRELAALAREQGVSELAEQVRRVPVQRSLDIAVPLEVAFDEWMRLDFLPEGAHQVLEIERRGRQRLTGRVNRFGAAHEWEAKVLEERRDDSFAWRSLRGSDVAGLVTFHRLGERLTRLELELDIVPTGVAEALALTLHLSDRMAEAELRRFKARAETISPDAYPARARHPNRRASKRAARDGRPRKTSKEE
jgi:uncharacterized membrane protein